MPLITGQGKLNEALHENDCDGKWTLRVTDPCANTKLADILTAINNQSRYIKFQAGETMSALKFVYVGVDGKIYLGDHNFQEKSAIVGITINAGDVNTLIDVATFGSVFDATFAFGFSNSLFLTTLGNVSTTSPTVGYRALVGKGLNDGQIFVDIDEVITL